ncbi:hypothetical protein [Ornithinibacillus californiensis]|nr:hypothetical protein [Ornithinibacillus californiensis]
MKKFLLLALLSIAIIFASASASSLFSYQEYDLANNEEPYPWPKK